ncbi:RNA polymerase sigma factor [Pseudomonas sp. H9]|uniref:RNA polymerase sigma factor n=1 Tax=Pseudomonas sp. H9 TaxID=483968 RepID=UPI001404D9EE|nr:sigma-70 family RNA polymerase sigma factor [Pseudomonas sp. H9]
MDNEHDLIERLRSGDAHALESLVKTHHAFLITLVTPLVGPDAADDVAQETWLKAVVAVSLFEGRSKFRTWLARIAINEAHSINRRKGREISLDGWGFDHYSPIISSVDKYDAWLSPSRQAHHEGPEELLAEVELHAYIRKQLHDLPMAQRNVVIMREFGGLEFKEIASALGMTEGNVRVQLHRGRQRIQAMLSRFQDQDRS